MAKHPCRRRTRLLFRLLLLKQTRATSEDSGNDLSKVRSDTIDFKQMVAAGFKARPHRAAAKPSRIRPSSPFFNAKPPRPVCVTRCRLRTVGRGRPPLRMWQTGDTCEQMPQRFAAG